MNPMISGREVWVADLLGPCQTQIPMIFPMVNPSPGRQQTSEQAATDNRGGSGCRQAYGVDLDEIQDGRCEA
jgi:hypothetical protein